MPYLFPFGQELHPLIQEDRTHKKVFVLGVYAGAVHARGYLTNIFSFRSELPRSDARLCDMLP